MVYSFTIILESHKLYCFQQSRLLNADSPPKPKEVKNWPLHPLNVGQITAVAVDTKGNPVLFHRADRIWTVE
jgi:hypothetical protein